MGYYIPAKSREPFVILVHDGMYYIYIKSEAFDLDSFWSSRTEPITAMVLTDVENNAQKQELFIRLNKEYNAIEDFFQDLCFMQLTHALKTIDDYFMPLYIAKKLSGQI